mgnify:CR=1 FL=1
MSESLPPKIGHILRLAEIIREVDGNHDLGASALAERILSHPDSLWLPKNVDITRLTAVFQTAYNAKREELSRLPNSYTPVTESCLADVAGVKAVLEAYQARGTPM